MLQLKMDFLEEGMVLNVEAESLSIVQSENESNIFAFLFDHIISFKLKFYNRSNFSFVNALENFK